MERDLLQGTENARIQFEGARSLRILLGNALMKPVSMKTRGSFGNVPRNSF
jgi:hypothetical protein